MHIKIKNKLILFEIIIVYSLKLWITLYIIRMDIIVCLWDQNT